MKNIHVLSTDKPSRVLYNSTLKSFCIQKEIDGMFINDGKVSGADFWGLEKALNNSFKPHNIYITSDEEIKIGDWVFDIFKNAYPVIRQLTTKEEVLGVQKTELKIILTTNVELIEDGVQDIDDEFLEWFVKNPSCEFVRIGKGYFKNDYEQSLKIIIPKEEAINHPNILSRSLNTKVFKQETLELAVLFHNTYEKLAPSFGYETREDTKIFDHTTPNGKLMMAVCKEIIKWQQEQDKNKYSEEEVENILIEYVKTNPTKPYRVVSWFQQIKKK